MTVKILDLLEQHKNDMNKINQQRIWWLYASSIVFTAIIFLIFGWEWLSGLSSRGVWWLIVSLMLIISINWWYWTMSVVRIMITHQDLEYELICSIINDVKTIRKDIKDLHNQTIDLFK